MKSKRTAQMTSQPTSGRAQASSHNRPVGLQAMTPKLYEELRRVLSELPVRNR